MEQLHLNRCPRFSQEQRNTLLDITRMSARGKIEMGLNLHGRPETPELGTHCVGDSCSITLPARGLRPTFGSFHTHMEMPAQFSNFDAYTAIARGETHICVGGLEEGSPVVRCWTSDAEGFGPAMSEAVGIELRRRNARGLERSDLMREAFDFGVRARPLFHEACVINSEAPRLRQASF